MQKEKDVLHLLYEWAIGHIQQAELAERLGEHKLGDKTLAQHFETDRKEAAKEAAKK